MILPIRQKNNSDQFLLDPFHKVNYARNNRVQECINYVDSLFEELFNFNRYYIKKNKIVLHSTNGMKFHFKIKNKSIEFIGCHGKL